MARIYLPDIATRNVRAIFTVCKGFVHAPEMIHAEVTAAWLQAVREKQMAWDDYDGLLAAFARDVVEERLILWKDGGLLLEVLAVQAEVTRLHLADPSNVPVIHTHDAFYVALARVLSRDGGRVILVTNDGRVWRCARALGLEVFHGNTCDLGRQQLNVGTPGQDFPEGADCCPCAYQTCPSTFSVNLAGLPPHLGSGTPRTQRQRTPSAPPARPPDAPIRPLTQSGTRGL